jgi:hypothetical protein
MRSIVCYVSPFEQNTEAVEVIERNDHGQIPPQSATAQVGWFCWSWLFWCGL